MRTGETGELVVFDLAQLKPEHFEGLIDNAFVIGDSSLALTLRSVARIRSPSPRAEPFSLVFDAPKNCSGAQGIYLLHHPVLGVLEIFLVPIAPSSGFPRYEAVFN